MVTHLARRGHTIALKASLKGHRGLPGSGRSELPTPRTHTWRRLCPLPQSCGFLPRAVSVRPPQCARCRRGPRAEPGVGCPSPLTMGPACLGDSVDYMGTPLAPLRVGGITQLLYQGPGWLRRPLCCHYSCGQTFPEGAKAQGHGVNGQGGGRMGTPWAPRPGLTAADPALAPVPWPALWGLGAPSQKGLVPPSSAPLSGVGPQREEASPPCPPLALTVLTPNRKQVWRWRPRPGHPGSSSGLPARRPHGCGTDLFGSFAAD